MSNNYVPRNFIKEKNPERAKNMIRHCFHWKIIGKDAGYNKEDLIAFAAGMGFKLSRKTGKFYNEFE